jgi:hypothetical protein
MDQEGLLGGRPTQKTPVVATPASPVSHGDSPDGRG